MDSATPEYYLSWLTELAERRASVLGVTAPDLLESPGFHEILLQAAVRMAAEVRPEERNERIFLAGEAIYLLFKHLKAEEHLFASPIFAVRPVLARLCPLWPFC